MKRYKQVLAAFVAMNLTVYVMPTGMVKISASVESQENENTDVKAEEASATEEVTAAENTVGTETLSNTEVAGSSEESTENVISAEASDTEEADSSNMEEAQPSDSTDIDVDNDTDTPDTNMSDTDTSDIEISDETDSDLSEEEMFSDGTQGEPEVADMQESTAVEATTTNNNTIELEQLKNYTPATKTMSITSAEELILLSNCDQEKVKEITINFNGSGSALDVTGKITAGTNISEYFKQEGTQESTVSENQQEIPDENISTESEETQSEEVQIEESQGDSESEIAELTEETVGEESEINESTMVAEQDVAAQADSVIAQQDYTFKGIGSETALFEGSITGAPSITINYTFFGGLSSKARISTPLSITWTGDDMMSMAANVYQFDSEAAEGHTFPLNISGSSEATMGNLIGTVQAGTDYASQTLNINESTVKYSYKESSSEKDATVNVDLSGNAGLICNNLKAGNICLNGFKLPVTDYKITSSGNNGNAGGLIGVMEANTGLQISSSLNNTVQSGTKEDVTAITIETSSTSGNAGGLVGEMQAGSRITTTTEGTVNLKNMNITGKTSAGGVVGVAKNVDWQLKSVLTIDSPTLKGDAVGAEVGGFIGKYTLENTGEAAVSEVFPENITINNPSLFIKGTQTDINSGSAGGYFGLLELNGLINYTIGSDDAKTKKAISAVYDKDTDGGDAWSYGAVVGMTITTNTASTLKIQNVTINSTFPIFRTNIARPKYHGGLVGYVGGGKSFSYVEIENVEVTASNPHAIFGGAVGGLAQGNILNVSNIKVTTVDGKQDAKIWDGGGVLGEANPGSVLELSGTTDLSGVSYDREDKKAGQLVGANDNALIYARGDGNGNGWKYIRSSFANPSNGSTYNDLCNYGQVLRLKTDGVPTGLSRDLITIDGNHRVILKQLSSQQDNSFSLSSADDFALFSIAWNSRGNFNTVQGITTETWKSIKSSTITLEGDIDLTGTGVMGLSRDTNAGDDDTFTGILNGNGHTVTLAIGETYGFQMKETTENLANPNTAGCGIVYATGNYHAAQGLFAKTGDNVKIRDVIIDGCINVSNGYSAITAGGVAAQMQGTTKINGVTAQESIYADGAAQIVMRVGGLYGTESGGTLVLDENTRISPKIDLMQVGDKGSWICAGGAMGKASSDGFKLQVKSAEVGNYEEAEDERAYISTDATNYAYIGGLIGLIGGINAQSNSHWIEIYNLEMNGFNVIANKATEVSGGLFGSIWEKVGVYFMNPKANADNRMLTVKNCKVSAGEANGVGGLAYRSSGIWEIRDYGVDMQRLTINSGGAVGLLVCHGENGQTRYENKETLTDIGALYLNTTADWKTAYKLAEDKNAISVTQSASGVFDEFVAHTAATAAEITENGQNGVVSIATAAEGEGRKGVAESGNTCTTYQNRTAYGKGKTNGCSRYYYDLDYCLKEVSEFDKKNNSHIDIPAELMLWSVYRYASENIRSYFVEKKDDNDKLLYSAPDVSEIHYTTITGAFDMQKYSYYPINLGSGVTIQNATFTFYNAEIEGAETAAENKSTQGTDELHTQHYTMHCALFLDQPGDTTVYLNNVTFGGSIGKVNSDGSGVLFAGTAQGSFDTSMHTATMNLNDVKFDNLKVNGVQNEEDYAPLLINKLGSYSTLNADGIKLIEKSYTPGTAAATSLIGRAGSETAKQISLSFLDIILPDEWSVGSKGIFTNATLLQSFMHDGTSSVATYNFYKNREWTGTTYTHGVTYGYEITETTEYENRQLYYYDEVGYGTDENNLVHTDKETDPNQFSSTGYLRYVAAPYNSTNHTHEIKVNQRMDNIVDGCGTYGHPYRIKNAREMQILSEYMATGKAPEGWCVTITGDQSVNHAGNDKNNYSTDATYKYTGSNWIKVIKEDGVSSEKWQPDSNDDGTMKNEIMHQYLLSAYYDLQGTDHLLELSNFGGFGNAENPFRGVLTSTGETPTTVQFEGNAPINGLIGYGYGCVVKNLVLSYENSNASLTYQENTSTSTQTAYYSKVVFGGVIGCVLGGDNIIDGVSVQYKSSWLTISGNKKHLIPVGGYVGEVSGGGVILRNLKKTDTGLTNGCVSGAESIANSESNATMYVNPYVGRVLDGFAFYEKTKTGTDATNIVSELNNTEKNYKINTLTDGSEDCVTVVADGTVTAQNAKGLLVLSAIVNSGAASGGTSRAYANYTDSSFTVNKVTYSFGGAYGKVRNADYGAIGSTTDTTDFAKAKSDDSTAPKTSNLPYLITKYCSSASAVFNLSGSASNAKIALVENGSYDMTTFGNGYQGIGARYVSNAILSEGTAMNPNGIVPELESFNGAETAITLNMPVKEYIDDNFRAAAVGGVFNLLRVGNGGSNVQNLTIQGKEDNSSVVSMQYYDDKGQTVSKETTNARVDVGAFAGTASRISSVNSSVSVSATFDSVSVKNLSITGSRNAGGILGSSITKPSTGIGSLQTEEKLAYGSSAYDIGIQLTNTSYDGLNVTALNGAGGCVGYISLINANAACSLEVTKQNLIVGNNSSITSTYDITTKKSESATKDTDTGAGGVFGYIRSSVNINKGNESKTYQNAVMQDVAVSAKRYAGGFVGKIDGKNYQINQTLCKAVQKTNIGLISTSVEINTENGSSDERREGAGGIVGYAKGASNVTGSITNCTVLNVQINGIATATKSLNQDHEGAGGIVGLITDSSSVNIENCTVTESAIYGAVAGGIAGITKSTTTFKDCTVTGKSKDEKSNIKARCTASGILGYWYSAGKGTLENCHVRYVDIVGQHWGVGALIGDGDSAGGSLYLFDTSVQDSAVTADRGSWYQGGGIIGDLRSDLTASNLLFSNVDITVGNKNSQGGGEKGLLVALVTAGKKIQIAGVSIQNIPENCKSYELVGKGEYKGYIAFSDYEGAALNENKQGTENLLGASAKQPYTVTSPKSSLSVYESESAGSDAKYLYGDSVSWGADNITTVEAKNIWDGRNEVNGAHYAYSKTGVEDSFDFSFISTYNTNNASATDKPADFPVVQLSGGDSDKVVDYLDILTNGGFSVANNITSDRTVSATTEVYTYTNGKFVKSDDTPAFQVTKTKNGKIGFTSTTDYDNDRNRFTLLTVTFAVKDADGKTEHKYNVMVPVIVRRMLEVDFSATLSYGTNFRSSDYENLTTHVLESFGSSITGFLRYTYNSKEGEFSDYGWQSYIDAGGNVAEPYEKVIWFNMQNVSLPQGTQLSLIDKKSGQVFYYTVTGKESNNKIPLKDFKDASSPQKAYEEPSIADLMKVTVEPDAEGTFVQVESDGRPVGSESATGQYSKPTVRIKNSNGNYEYYRLAGTGEEGTKYKIKVDADNLKFVDTTGQQNVEKSMVTEEYYLVITVPSTSESNEFLNGTLTTEIVTGTIPHQVHPCTIKGEKDVQYNTASTYRISKGYKQNLKEKNNYMPSSKNMSVSGATMTVDVVDTITFPKSQVYQDELTSGSGRDELYQRFVGGLQKTINNTSTAEIFPNGTSGHAYFYVYRMEGDQKIYYKYENGQWKNIGSTEQAAVDYPWNSNNGSMELMLSTDGSVENAVSLQEVRKSVKETSKSEDCTFYVEVKMDVKLSDGSVIPESKLGTDGLPEDFTQLIYSSQVSTEKQSITYSTNRATEMQTTTRYYRDAPISAKLTYEADQISQLGINLLDLQYLDAAKENSLIDTTAIYDLSSMKNLEDTLRNSNGIRFTLSLLPKNTESNVSQEDYQAAAGDADQYLSVSLKSENSGEIVYSSGSWSWTVPKETYWDEETNNIKTKKNVFDGSILTQAIQLKVNVDNVQASKHFYSNYKVLLTAEIREKGENSSVGIADDNIIYTLAKIKPEFIDLE